MPQPSLKECPPVDPELVRFLEAAYPDRCPDPKDHERSIWAKVGNAEVVRFLRHTMEQQHENPLGDD